jgi:hypothetical protein
MRVRPLLVLLVSVTGCTIPTLKDLEKERVRGCDANHLCASGYTCVAGECVVGESPDAGECSPGATQACGSSVGECVPGQKTCGSSGKFGACVGEIAPVAEICDGKDNDCNGTADDMIMTSPMCGQQMGVCAGKQRRCINGTLESACGPASYGPDFELTNETRCDGKDNDCDGMPDENLFTSCLLQQGVCSGARQACQIDGGSSCTASDYLSNSVDYEALEARCDGLDNDCDGRTDNWLLLNVSNSSGVAKRPAATVTASGAILVYWQDGARTYARVVGADGTLGTIVQPSLTAQLAARAYFPAVASSGPLNWAAWAEELADGGQRIQTAPVDNTGRTSLDGGISFQMPLGSAGQIVDVATAVDGTTAAAVVAVQVGTNIEVGAFSPTGQQGSTTQLAQGVRPSVAHAGGTLFWVAYQDNTTNARLCLLNSSNMSSTCQTVQTGAVYPSVRAIPGANPVAAQVIYATSPGFNLFRRACDGGTCAAAVATGFSSNNFIGFLREVPGGSPGQVITAWDDAPAGVPTAWYGTVDGGAQKVLPAADSTHRPIPLSLGTGKAVVFVFDTEGSAVTGIPTDEVVLQRMCLP